MTGYLNKVENTQYMPFVMKDEKLLEKYESIWNRINNIIGKNILINNPVYDREYLNTKFKSNNGKINTDFHSKKPS